MGNLVSLVLWAVNGIVNEKNVKRKTRRRKNKRNLISSSSSSMAANAKENLPPATIDGVVVNNEQKKIVKRRRRKKENVICHSSFSSSSYYSPLANPIHGGVNKKKKINVEPPIITRKLTPSEAKEMEESPAFARIYGASDSEHRAMVDLLNKRILNSRKSSSSSSMENAKENQQKKDAVHQPYKKIVKGKKGNLTSSSSSMANAKEDHPAVVTIYGGSDNQHEVDQLHMANASKVPAVVYLYGGLDNIRTKKIVEPRTGKEGNLISSSSSMANAKENRPLVMYGVYTELIDDIHQSQKIVKKVTVYKCPTMTKVLGKFKLSVLGAEFFSSEVIVMQSKHNNTGKTTFLRLLAGLLKPDTVEGNMKMPQFNVSYMPPKINPVSRSTVRHMLQQRITHAYNDPYFVSNVMQPLLIEQLMDQQVVNLSYGECQRVELCLCLGKPADIYLLDEPTAHLDPELGMAAVKAIRGFIHHAKKTAFVVEPNLKRALYISDRVIVFQGKPTIRCSAGVPQFFFSYLTDEEWLIVEDGSYRGYH